MVLDGVGKGGKDAVSLELAEAEEEWIIEEANCLKKCLPASPVAVKLLVGAGCDSVVGICACIKEQMVEEISLGRGLMAKCFGSCWGTR